MDYMSENMKLKEEKEFEKVFAFFGDPAEHSRSPLMHNAAFKALGLNYDYRAFRVKKEDLKNAIMSIRNGEIAGANISMPHKESVLEYLDEIDPIALSCGAVNTVVNRDGKLVGYNTDATGFAKALKEETPIKGEKAVVMGHGGAAKAVITALSMEGIEEITVITRSGSETKESSPCSILINATPVGMGELKGKSLVPEWIKLNKDMFVMDLIYDPEETELLRQAREEGCRGYKNGLDMLLYQGAEAFKLFTGEEAPIDVMREALGR